MTRYTGTVVTVDHDDRDFAFIDIKTVTKIDGSPADLDTDKDIFIHHSDAPGALVVGDVLSFAVTNDKKRRNAFRASGARIASGFPIEAGIEIHFDQRVLDHPMVPIRWCIKPAALRAMEENPEMTWYPRHHRLERRCVESEDGPADRNQPGTHRNRARLPVFHRVRVL